MSSAIYYCTKVVSNTTQQTQGSTGKSTPTTAKNLASGIGSGRRQILLSSSTSILAAVIATDTIIDQPPESRTALIQKYLKKSQENKEKNDKERLENYYKRNYKDYFGLLEGSLRAKEDGELSESEKGILDWLEKNK